MLCQFWTAFSFSKIENERVMRISVYAHVSRMSNRLRFNITTFIFLISRYHKIDLYAVVSIIQSYFLASDDLLEFWPPAPTFEMAYSSSNHSQYKPVQGEDGNLPGGLPHDPYDSAAGCTPSFDASIHSHTNFATWQEPQHIEMQTSNT